MTLVSDEEKQKLFRIVLSYLEKRECTSEMLQKKLLKKGFSICSIKLVLQQAIQEGILSDARFCEVLISRRIRQNHGPLRIIAELRQCGISEEMITAQIPQDESIWLAAITTLLQKKFSCKGLSKQEQFRQVQYLHYRGFRMDQIRKARDLALSE